jgi:hypothetical protein
LSFSTLTPHCLNASSLPAVSPEYQDQKISLNRAAREDALTSTKMQEEVLQQLAQFSSTRHVISAQQNLIQIRTQFDSNPTSFQFAAFESAVTSLHAAIDAVILTQEEENLLLNLFGFTSFVDDDEVREREETPSHFQSASPRYPQTSHTQTSHTHASHTHASHMQASLVQNTSTRRRHSDGIIRPMGLPSWVGNRSIREHSARDILNLILAQEYSSRFNDIPMDQSHPGERLSAVIAIDMAKFSAQNDPNSFCIWNRLTISSISQRNTRNVFTNVVPPRPRTRNIVIRPTVKASGNPGDPEDSDDSDSSDDEKGPSEPVFDLAEIPIQGGLQLLQLPTEILEMILLFLSPSQNRHSLQQVTKSCFRLYEIGWRFMHRCLAWDLIHHWANLYEWMVCAGFLQAVPEPPFFKSWITCAYMPGMHFFEPFAQKRTMDRVNFKAFVNKIRHSIEYIDFTLLSIVGEETHRHLVTRVALSAPHLKHLNMYKCKWINDDFLSGLATMSRNLITLNLSYCSTITDYGISLLGEHCHNIRGLILRDCRLLTDVAVLHIGAKFPHLRQLVLAGCIELTDLGIESLLSRSGRLGTENVTVHQDRQSSQIRHLVLVRLSHLTDRVAHYFVKHAPFLQQLNLSGCQCITSDAVVKLLRWSADAKMEGKNALKVLDVSDCMKVSVDVVNAGIASLVEEMFGLGFAGMRLCTINLPEAPAS